jgi:SAM-dependent methyltransferase
VDNNQTEWNKSYCNRDNFVFFPHEEVIRFVSKFIRKKTGLDEYRDIAPNAGGVKVLDLGCGIGRHVIYCHEMGLDSYGVDLSETAIQVAIDWAVRKGMPDSTLRIRQGDVRHLPWDDGYFDFAVSHGVLDSMPFEIARAACMELARKMTKEGLFYCDLISGDDASHAREYAGEEVVTANHENGTIQSYFNLAKIKKMIEGAFEIVECILIRREEVMRGGYASRYHLILKKV